MGGESSLHPPFHFADPAPEDGRFTRLHSAQVPALQAAVNKVRERLGPFVWTRRRVDTTEDVVGQVMGL